MESNVPSLRPERQRRRAALVASLYVGAFLDQQAHVFGAAVRGRRHHQGSAPQTGLRVDIGAMGHQQPDLGQIRRAPNQRRGVQAIAGVGIGARIEQQRNRWYAAERRSVDQKGVAAPIAGVDIGPAGQLPLQTGQVILPDGLEQIVGKSAVGSRA